MHSFAAIPMQKRFAFEQFIKREPDALKTILDRGDIANHGRCHIHAARFQRNNRGLYVVRNPAHKTTAMLVETLLGNRVNLGRRQITSAIHDTRGQKLTATGLLLVTNGSETITLAPHIITDTVERPVGVTIARASLQQRRVRRSKEMQSRKRNQVCRHLTQVAVEQARETQRCGTTAHHQRQQPVDIGKRRILLTQHIVRDIKECFIVGDKCAVTVVQNVCQR
mmetsp:Transcript_15234/g.23123  ORF Transcript_15234/g.23123 Transcript_15234/m.23123 type:complete len:224 (-) Transcript_15234:689-1360(-)